MMMFDEGEMRELVVMEIFLNYYFYLVFYNSLFFYTEIFHTKLLQKSYMTYLGNMEQFGK